MPEKRRDPAESQRLPVVVLISGGGSNLNAIINAFADTAGAEPQPAYVAHVVSNRADAGGLNHARVNAIPATVVAHADYPEREHFDAAIAEIAADYPSCLIVLAGFMRVLGEAFVAAHANRIVNIHPSLLPSYPGLHTHQRAIDDGARRHGASVHFVVPALDAGPIITQAWIKVRRGDDAASLAARVLRLEHIIYPRAIRWIAQNRIRVVQGRVYLDGAAPPVFTENGKPAAAAKLAAVH